MAEALPQAAIVYVTAKIPMQQCDELLRDDADDRVDRFTRWQPSTSAAACDLLAEPPRAPLANADGKTHLIRSALATMLVVTHVTMGRKK